MALQIIAKGELRDFGEGAYYLHQHRQPSFRLFGEEGWDDLGPYIGKTLVISYEEPEEESVGLMEKLAGSMRHALAPV